MLEVVAPFLKVWGALLVAGASLALGVFNLRRTAVISRAEKRSQLTLEALTMAGQSRLLAEDLAKIVAEWQNFGATAPNEKTRRELIDGATRLAKMQTKIATITAELFEQIESLESIPSRRFTSERVEAARRKMFIARESLESVRRSCDELKAGLEQLRALLA